MGKSASYFEAPPTPREIALAGTQSTERLRRGTPLAGSRWPDGC